VNYNTNNKLVLFGAGKIGRSFIGQLFSRGGYEVVFIDIDKNIIDELNIRNNYNVIIKSEKDEILNIKNVRGVLSSDVSKVADEIATASILAVSVGANVMAKIAPVVAKGLLLRYDATKDNPLDIILAENLRDAAPFFRKKILPFLPADYPFNKLVGLIETSIGKMVPIMMEKDIEIDILQVFAEPYNNLILDKEAFKNSIPQIAGLSPKENIKAWVDRKLFIHNLGHATAAYLGYIYNPNFNYLYEVLEIPDIRNAVRNTMLQAATILCAKYPDDFTMETLVVHIDNLLFRFQNRALGDTVFRVGCDLMRKLSTMDRLAGAIHLAKKLNLPYDRILYSWVCGCFFRATDENGKLFMSDVEFITIAEKGVKEVLEKIGGFSEQVDQDLFEYAESVEKDVFLLKSGLTER